MYGNPCSIFFFIVFANNCPTYIDIPSVNYYKSYYSLHANCQVSRKGNSSTNVEVHS